GHFDEGGDAGGVVHGAVVDLVSVDRYAQTEMIEVGADDHVFALESGVAAGKDTGEVLRLRARALDRGFGANVDGQRKMWKRLLAAQVPDDLLARVAAADEQLLRPVGSDEH